MTRVPLCRLDDVEDGQSAGFIVTWNDMPRDLLAVRRGDKLFVYVNSCPHIGAPLDFTPGQFLNVERTHILCVNHMALFRIEDGECIVGPCFGDKLDPVETMTEDGAVYITAVGGPA